ncbi:cytochrome P450 [Artomyces pyxidatus]|uniref:Cytochrome P450 n=1 Tax=Artomyces pyxidatus TaxID=48021 RepID=A0ACB8SKJ1_9AGAM|nr:cytochrome P450 [Artomyces pyxidatus]
MGPEEFLDQLFGYLYATTVWRFILGLLVVSTARILFSVVRLRVKQAPLWKIPGPPIVSLVTGNYLQMFEFGATKFHDYITEKYGRIVRIRGFFGDTQLFVSDPTACTTILLKEQDIFEQSDWFIEVNRLGLGQGLLATLGGHHRKQRKQLNPVFSAKHMRSMVPLFHRITHELREVLKTQVGGARKELDMVEWLSRLALELIAQGGLGCTFDSLNPHGKENEFRGAIKEFVPTLSSLIMFQAIFTRISKWPPRLLRLAVKFIPMAMLHNAVRVADVLHKHTKAVFDNKKALLQMGEEEFTHQLSEGKDIISVLMKSNDAASEEDRLPEEEIMAQMSTFMFGATDTTSTALSRILYVLAHRQDVQDKLRQELNDAVENFGGEDLGYDELIELPYLDAVCRETLRVFPPLPVVSRIARADTILPFSQPIKTADGMASSVFIPRGTTVMVNIPGINRDPGIWGADAAEWKPERWLAPLPKTVAEARVPGVYSHTLTFLGGGHACIGFKFSQLEIKTVLSHLLRVFRFSPSPTEVVWLFRGFTTPSEKGSTAVEPQMPIVVEMI